MQVIDKSFKFKLCPTAEMVIVFSQWAGNCRFLYNWGLSQRIKKWENEKQHLSYVSQAAFLKDLKQQAETNWLSISPAQTLQQTLRDLDQAFKNFFRRIKIGKTGKDVGFPKFKKKGRCTDSFRFPDPKQFSIRKVSHQKGIVTLPKVGAVKFNLSREIEGRIRNCTISKEGDHWFISFNCETIIESKKADILRTDVGIDRGVVKTLTLSDETCYNEKDLKLPTEKIKKLEKIASYFQSKLKLKQRFSRHWIFLQKKIAKIHRKIKRIRIDWIHKITTKLAKNHSFVFLEDLNVSNMSKSAAGTLDSPGCNVKVKSGLNRAILRQGWFLFQTVLEYKSKWHESKVVYVSPRNSSRECSRCGHISAENRLSQESFLCQQCGLAMNADKNAAINIFTRGQRGRVHGDTEVCSGR